MRALLGSRDHGCSAWIDLGRRRRRRSTTVEPTLGWLLAVTRASARNHLPRSPLLSDSYHYVWPADESERAYLDSLIREDFDRCHPGETLEDVKWWSSFSKEDKGLLHDWMAIAAISAAANRVKPSSALAA